MPWVTEEKFVPNPGGSVKNGAVSGDNVRTTTYVPDWNGGITSGPSNSGSIRPGTISSFSLPDSGKAYLGFSFICAFWMMAFYEVVMGYNSVPLGRAIILGFIVAIPIYLFDALRFAFGIAFISTTVLMLTAAFLKENGITSPYGLYLVMFLPLIFGLFAAAGRVYIGR